MIDLLKSITTPIVWLLVLLGLGLILVKCLRRNSLSRLGWLLILLGTLSLFFLSLPLVSNLLVYSLERQYKEPSAVETLSSLDIVVILGGGLYPAGGLREYAEAKGITYSRLFSGVRVFKQSGARTLALCGGSPEPGSESEAEIMKALALELGVEENRVITELDFCHFVITCCN